MTPARFARGLSRLLAAAGFHVLAFESAECFLRHHEAWTPELVQLGARVRVSMEPTRGGNAMAIHWRPVHHPIFD
jgi:FixJ family two-component response regulator